MEHTFTCFTNWIILIPLLEALRWCDDASVLWKENPKSFAQPAFRFCKWASADIFPYQAPHPHFPVTSTGFPHGLCPLSLLVFVYATDLWKRSPTSFFFTGRPYLLFHYTRPVDVFLPLLMVMLPPCFCTCAATLPVYHGDHLTPVNDLCLSSSSASKLGNATVGLGM